MAEKLGWLRASEVAPVPIFSPAVDRPIGAVGNHDGRCRSPITLVEIGDESQRTAGDRFSTVHHGARKLVAGQAGRPRASETIRCIRSLPAISSHR